jgi:hypothetical protein
MSNTLTPEQIKDLMTMTPRRKECDGCGVDVISLDDGQNWFHVNSLSDECFVQPQPPQPFRLRRF